MVDRKTTATDAANVTTNSGFATWSIGISTTPIDQVTGTSVNSGFAWWAIGISTTAPETGNVTTIADVGAWGRGDILADDLNLIGTIGVPDVSQPVYRGLVGISYVFSVGSPPTGATDVTIVGYT